jgi:tryptophan-rich sensory protein
MKLNKVAKLAICCAVPLLIGFIGSLFTTSASLNNWYANLNKPSFNPPNWIFGPVWTTLYILMGIAVFLVWQKGLDNIFVRLAIICFIIQLTLNAAWTPLFFGLRSPLAGLVDIILLLSAINLTTLLFLRISKPAAVLLVPYMLWVLFATILNASIFLMNR